jgi:hypothetical protein
MTPMMSTSSHCSPDGLLAPHEPEPVAPIAFQHDCAICYEAMLPGETTFTLGCRHTFHTVCLANVMTSGAAHADRCPMCLHWSEY